MGLFDLTGAVALLATHTVTVQRPAPVTFGAGGIANAQSFSSTTVTKCSVQPITGRDVQHMREGDQVSDYLCVWGPFVFAENDRLSIPGKGDFKVHKLLNWNDHGSYSKAMARKLDANEPRS